MVVFFKELPPVTDVTGELTVAAHPWIRQFYNDLHRLAWIDVGFACKWRQKHRWAIFTDYFLKGNPRALRATTTWETKSSNRAVDGTSPCR